MRHTVVAMSAAGLAVGWMMGLSVSPVTQTVLGTLVTALAGAAAVFSGVARVSNPGGDTKSTEASAPQVSTSREPKPWIDARPIGVLIVGAAIGATCGVWARAYNLLAPSPTVQIEQWVDASGMTKSQVALALLNSRSGAGGGSGGGAPPALVPLAIGLNSAGTELCNEVRGAVATANDQKLRIVLSAGWPALRDALVNPSAQHELLQAIARTLCP